MTKNPSDIDEATSTIPHQGPMDFETRVVFTREVAKLINRFSLENESDTPDYILAAFMVSSLDLFQSRIRERTEWYKP